jgi:predicted small integral membrane protein
MIVRLSKCALLAGAAIYFSLVVFNNTTDYDSNYQFVRHVLMMDTTFPGNHGMWRALRMPRVHTAFYLSVIAWEITCAVLCWWGTLRLALNVRATVMAFKRAKNVAVAGLTMGCLLWLVAFLSVGGEWFLMWQSRVWNGEEAAFRMFAVMGLILIYMVMPEYEMER